MRTVLMMVTNILEEQSLQVAFIERNNLIQQVSSTASHPTLRDCILPGAPKQSPTRLNMFRIYNKAVRGWQQLCY
jgi:hypothetical protein